MTGNEKKIFELPIDWVEIDDNEYSYSSNYGGYKLRIKVNSEFPDVPLYTLSVGGKSLSFDNWPNVWSR